MPSLALAFGLAFSGAVGCFELLDLVVGPSRKRSREKGEAGGRYPDFVASCGAVVSAGGAAFLSAKRVLGERSAFVDALVSRPGDALATLRRAGGRVGLRFAVYGAAMQGASLATAAVIFDPELPLSALVVMAPAMAMAAVMVGLPALLPALAGFFLGGSAVGAALGRWVLRHVHVLVASGASEQLALSAVLRSALWGHPVDAAFGARRVLVRVGVTVASVAALLPKALNDVEAMGLNDFRGGGAAAAAAAAMGSLGRMSGAGAAAGTSAGTRAPGTEE